MADNFKYTEPGTGLDFGSSDIGGVHYQKVINVDGTGATVSPITDDELRASALLVVSAGATSSSVTSLSNSVTSQTLLASNVNRKGASIFNDDTAASLYLKLGAVASVTSFTVKIAPGGFYELPYPAYTGIIDAISSAATGSIRITELT